MSIGGSLCSKGGLGFSWGGAMSGSVIRPVERPETIINAGTWYPDVHIETPTCQLIPWQPSCCFVAHGTQSVLYNSDVITLQQVIINLLVETANDVDMYHHSYSTSIWGRGKLLKHSL